LKNIVKEGESMSKRQEHGVGKPVIVGAVCFVLAVIYVFFMFYVGRPKESGKTGASSSITKPVRLGAFSTAIDYAPLIVAQSKGWIQTELGIKASQVEFTTFQTLPTINEAFAAGRLDVVVEAEVPAIVGRAAGIDLRITGLETTLTEGILVRSGSRIANLQDLRGKRVAALSGTAMHFGLVKLLRGAGLDPQAVNLINMTPPDAAAAFASGQIDAWSVWPPWPEQQVIAKAGRFIPGADAKVQSVVVMRKGFIEEGTAARGIMRVIGRAKAWLAQNPTEGVALISQQLKLPEDVVRLAWSKHDWSAQLSADVSRDIEEKAAFLVNQKMIQHTVSAAEVVEQIPEQ
jgi:sulfonate transport system substrate-binding protein